MLPGTIIMLLVIIIGIFGGTVFFVWKNLKNETEKKALNEEA